MSKQHINKYIEGKYGKFGVDRYAAYQSLILIKLVFCLWLQYY